MKNLDPSELKTALRLMASRFRAAREIAGLSAREVTRRLGIADTARLMDLERGVTLPNAVTTARLAAVYARQTDYFLQPVRHVYKAALIAKDLEREQASYADCKASNQDAPKTSTEALK